VRASKRLRLLESLLKATEVRERKGRYFYVGEHSPFLSEKKEKKRLPKGLKNDPVRRQSAGAKPLHKPSSLREKKDYFS